MGLPSSGLHERVRARIGPDLAGGGLAAGQVLRSEGWSRDTVCRARSSARSSRCWSPDWHRILVTLGQLSATCGATPQLSWFITPDAMSSR